MKDGIIEQIGTPEEILTNPASEYVEAFVEKVDRKTIITAESLMFTKPSLLRIKKMVQCVQYVRCVLKVFSFYR